jgi:hypothetical protein
MDAPNLLNPERRMLLAMQRAGTGTVWSLGEVLAACEWTDQAVAVGAGHGLQNHGLVTVEETVLREVHLDVEGERAVDQGLLEQRLWNWILQQDSPSMQALQQAFERHEAGPGVGLLKQLGVALEGGVFSAADADAVTASIAERMAFLNSLPAPLESLDSAMVAHFRSRKQLVHTVERTERSWSITPAGASIPADRLVEQHVITDITPELLQTIPCRPSLKGYEPCSSKWAFPNWSTIMFRPPVGTWTPCSSPKTTPHGKCRTRFTWTSPPFCPSNPR